MLVNIYILSVIVMLLLYSVTIVVFDIDTKKNTKLLAAMVVLSVLPIVNTALILLIMFKWTKQ